MECDGTALSSADRTKYEADRLQLDSRLRMGRTAQTPKLDLFKLPKQRPSFSEMLIDDLRRIYVRQHSDRWEGFERSDPGSNTAPRHWWVFAPSGQLLGTTSTPHNVVVKDIRDNRVLAERVNDSGLSTLVVYPLSAAVIDASR